MKKRILNNCLTTAVAKLPNHNEPYCHYTFIVQDNRIVSDGVNRKASPLTFLGYESHTKMHSEVNAYFRAKRIDKKASFEAVNIRLTRTGAIRNSKPCKCCFGFLKGLGCKRIWFTTNLENFASMEI